MAIISFALTEQPFMESRKTATRRFWADAHLERWQRWYDEGKLLHDGWSKVPFAGGSHLGYFILTARPYLQPLGHMTEDDLIAEGGMCPNVATFCDLIGHPPDAVPAVVSFVKVDRFHDCKDCGGGRWAHTIDRTGLSGAPEIRQIFHISPSGVVSANGDGCLPF